MRNKIRGRCDRKGTAAKILLYAEKAKEFSKYGAFCLIFYGDVIFCLSVYATSAPRDRKAAALIFGCWCEK
jgi:hypothetical protein